MSTDPRMAAMVKINDPNPKRDVRMVAVWPGLRGAPLRKHTDEAVGAAEAFLTSEHHARTNRNLSPGEVKQRLDQAALPTLRSLNATSKAFRAERENVRAQVDALTPVKPYEQMHLHVMHFDLLRLQNFRAMDAGDRAALLHGLRLEPMMNLDMAETLLRVPMDISSIDARTRAEISVGLLKVLKRDEFLALDVQIDQLAVTQNALRMAVDIVREATGHSSALFDEAPDAFNLTYGAEANEAVRWVPPLPTSSGTPPVFSAPAKETSNA